ncbi:MAG: LPXTG cell wall anchor domain-containing protein, partial [Erysipelotrichaceae bacterium]|nr:LPXTG cell wall anchor domain-containing protein [Erysipelotrichaceae bacterium]
VAVDPATKTFQLVFPAEYSLDKDAVYSVTVNVKPTEQAYTEYGQSGYPHTGDDKTDDPAVPAGQETSSNKAGFYSNVNEAARLTYTITGDSQPYAVNYQKPVIQVKPVVDFKIQKTKEDGTTPLDGAQFALYKQDGQTKKYYSVDESGTVSWVDTETNLPKASGSNSLFEAGNLENGTYYVKETAVPNGYYPLDTELKVVVADGTLTVEKVKGTGTIPVAKDTSQPPHTVYTATVANYTGYNLPDTGGSGTSMFTMIGLLLLGFGLVYGFFSRCKSEGGLG